ncbi:nucleotide sugar dehydrogenase [Streptomyces badius]
MNICVVALGKIGLPLAVQFAAKGHKVNGADVNEKVVELVNAATEPFPGEHDLDVKLKETVGAGLLSATTDTTAAVAASDAVVVVVPLFVDAEGTPDFGWMDAATKAIAAGLKPGTLVSYETTLPVGTTSTRWAPMLAEDSPSPVRTSTWSSRRSGCSPAGSSPTCAATPSSSAASTRRPPPRVSPSTRPFSTSTSARTCPARTASGTSARQRPPSWRSSPRPPTAMSTSVWPTSSPRFADRNDIDVKKVIEACNSQPYSHIHQPGIAVGGHCIPIYPRMYLWTPGGDRRAFGP